MNIYTNLNLNDMENELKAHLRNITNKQYIKDVLMTNLKHGFITQNIYNKLYDELLKEKEILGNGKNFIG